MAITTTVGQVKASYKAIFRVDLADATANATAAAIDGGQISLAQYQSSLIAQSATTTQAALALSASVTGLVPTSEKLDSLTAFAKLQFDYYANTLKSANAQLGAYEALGKAYAADPSTSASFAAKFGALSATDFVTAAYASVFNVPATAAASANLISQVVYFTDLYTKAGIAPADAALQAKGAVLGQIIGYAATAPVTLGTSTLDDTLILTLQTLANEAIAETVPSNVYDKSLPGVGGAQIVLAAGLSQSVSLDLAAPFKATVFNDTVTGTVGGLLATSVNTGAGDDSIGTAASALIFDQTSAVAIDGSGGTDSLYGTLAVNLAATTTIKNVEKVYFGATAASIVDTTLITGATETWSFKNANALTFSNVAQGAKVGVDSALAGSTSTFTYAAGATSADLTLKALAAGSEVAVGNLATLKTVNLDAASNSITKVTVGAAVETVKVSGAGELAITELTTTVKTFDASAATKAVALGTLVAFDGAADTTLKFGAGNDALFVASADADKDTITLGAGNDAVTVTAVSGNAAVASGAFTKGIVISDFAKGFDTITFAGVVKSTASFIGISTEEDAVKAVALVAAQDQAFFEFQGSTYIYNDFNGDDIFDAAVDGIVKLTGATGLVLATDILA